ncbi:MAG: non-canonical purine NTP pyrophosphatase [Patescibacteria group bacterium]|nr:non-canonical purine NTP pyrophosphatase [Patescibacteria group bacterium]MDE2438017.1 non-canonical purine NTP pyrophosphatase [Patescibacteria group bacterium]
MLQFVTGNTRKYEEMKGMLDIPFEQHDIDLPEPQSLSAEEIIREKLRAAEMYAEGEYFVEDTSLYFDCFRGMLPGPLVKWFLEVLRPEGLADLVARMGTNTCVARTLIGYLNAEGEIAIFEGTQKGIIVSPRGTLDFGWGPVFQPEGETRTFGEMERSEKFRTSMRAFAARRFSDYYMRTTKRPA